MIGTQEFILQTGDKVILKTVPVDPRDAFRGDYVILSYEISAEAERRMGAASNYTLGDNIFITLNTDSIPASVKSVSPTRPTNGLYVIGKIKKRNSTATVRVSFPRLAQYYVEDGKGRALEDMRNGELHVEISVKNGEARIVNLRDKDMAIIDVNGL